MTLAELAERLEELSGFKDARGDGLEDCLFANRTTLIAALRECEAWRNVDSEHPANNPMPDSVLRWDYLDKARKLQAATNAALRGG